MSDRFESVFETKEKIITKKPSMYKVIMLNDHYTTMDFVVDTLM
ncbi:MAG: ATP-dependent Clp protease adaptor ClpS, partial [Spirochaetes bacterium]|nr:ATP-dependent Clp protease adaptor ClpS [Spirochaetota bacterium]